MEGPADISLYQKFYANSEFRHFGSCDNVCEAIRICNRVFGKTSLVIGIIDRDDKSESEIKALAEENIFVLKEREIESIFLCQDVIEGLFGQEVFQRFSQETCVDATTRTDSKVTEYEEALRILKKKLSSKYNIRQLLKIAGIKNSGNKNNIDLLSSMLEEKGLVKMLEDILPQIPDIKSRTTNDNTNNFKKKLQSFIPNEVSRIEKASAVQQEKER